MDSPIKKTRDALQKDLDEIRRAKKASVEAYNKYTFLLSPEEEEQSRQHFIDNGRAGQIEYLESINKAYKEKQ